MVFSFSPAGRSVPVLEPGEEHLESAFHPRRDAGVLADAREPAHRAHHTRRGHRDVLDALHHGADAVEAVVGLVGELLQLRGQVLELGGHRTDLALHDGQHALRPLRGALEREQHGDEYDREGHDAGEDHSDRQRAHRGPSMAGASGQVKQGGREAPAFIDFPLSRPLYSTSRGPPVMSLHDRFDELRRRNEAAELSGGPDRVARQHGAGKKTARERIELLLDKGSSIPKSWAWWSTRPTTSGWTSSGSPATGWSPAAAASTAARCSCSPRTSPSSAARCPRPTRGRSARSWIWPSRRARRSSGSTTPVGLASRRAWSHWPATPTSSSATRSPPASSRRSRRSWVPAPGERCIRPPSPTSCSWSSTAPTCS